MCISKYSVHRRRIESWGHQSWFTQLENIMKVKRGIVLMCLLALGTFVLAQTSVDGTWAGEIQGGRGPQQITLTLKRGKNK